MTTMVDKPPYPIVQSDALPGSWKSAKRLWGHSLHRLAPYNGTFPSSLAHYFIRVYSQRGQVVLDPFCGSGTTALEACVTGRVGIGNDPFPYAYLLTRAKVRALDEAGVRLAVAWLRREMPDRAPHLDNPDIECFFHPYTLKQILRVREALRDKDTDQTVFLKALMCGVLHGPSKMFLSVQMKDTAASSPNYIKKYVGNHGLEYPKRDVFESLANKAARSLKDVRPEIKGQATDADVRRMPFKDESINLIVTSPPYLHVLDYSWHHWVRLWFLGEDRKASRDKMFITGNREKFGNFMKDALKEMYRVLAPNSACVIVIGDVKEKKINAHGKTDMINGAQLVANLAEPIGFTTRMIIEDPYPLGSRSFVVYNESRYAFDSDKKSEVCSVPRDCCLVLQKGEATEHKPEFEWSRHWQTRVDAYAPE